MVLPPKRPLSAYACFIKRFRNQLRKKGELTTFLEFVRRAGDKWRHMTAKEKEPFRKQAQIDSNRYKLEMRRGNENFPKRPMVTDLISNMVLPPKRPLSAYACFIKRFRNQLRKKGELTTFLEFVRRAGDKWRTMTPREKQPYINMSDKDRDRYKSEKRFMNPERRRGNENAPKRPMVTYSNMVLSLKRPMSAYACFLKRFRNQLKKKGERTTFLEFTQRAQNKWRIMTPKEKQPFIKMSEKDRDRYKSEMQTYMKPEGQRRGNKNAPKRPMVTYSNMVLSLKRPMSAYACFLKRFRNQLKKKGERTTFLEFTQRAQNKWRIMTPKEKQPFIKMAEKDRDRYKSEMQTYMKPEGQRRGNKNAPKRPMVTYSNMVLSLKRPMSAYACFLKRFRNQLKKKGERTTFLEFTQRAQNKWRKMSCEEKRPFVKIAKKDRGRYYQEMASYVPRRQKLQYAPKRPTFSTREVRRRCTLNSRQQA